MRVSTPLPWPLMIVLSCLLMTGCGGGSGASQESSSGDQAAAAPAAPTIDNSAGGGGASAGATATTPEAVVESFLRAVKNNQLGEIWDLLPASYQQDINGVVREFGGHLDAELWDQTFALVNRYLKLSIEKQDMILEMPQSQESLAMLGSMGFGNAGTWPKEKIKELSAPSNAIMTALLTGELSSVQKLKSFEGKAFLSGTMSTVLKNLRTLIELGLKEVQQNPELQGNIQVQMIASQFNLNQMLDQISVTAGSVNGDNAVVNIQMGGQPGGMPLNMTRVEGKWLPTGMAGGFKQMMQMGKMMAPMGAQSINDFKEQGLALIQELEPLIEDLEQANTADEFQVAYAKVNQMMERQVSGLAAGELGVPGIGALPGGLGGGSRIGGRMGELTVVIPQELSDAQLIKLVAELEKLTDSPEEAILLPKVGLGETTIEITPVENFSRFTQRIQFGEVSEQDDAEHRVTIQLPSGFGL
jgi:hypothetical protein